MSQVLKGFEWKNHNKCILKIESVNAYLADLLFNAKVVFANDNELFLSCVAEGDMEYDETTNTLILCDNSDYWVTYDNETVLFDVFALENILVKKNDGKGILNSKNYVGILDLALEDYSIVVKSKKVNYDRDFIYLRNCISDFCSDLLSRSSSYYSEHFSKTTKFASNQVNYSELAYLRSMFSPDKFPAWIDYFIMHAEHRYDAEMKLKPLYEIEEIDAEEYMKALSSNDIFYTKRVQGIAGRVGYAPYECKATDYELTYDIVENRFVKFFVRYIFDYLCELSDKADVKNVKLATELEKMRTIIGEKLEHPFWNNISSMERVPFNSQILQKKYPYNLIFQMYTDFTLKSDINLGDIDYKYMVGQKDAPMLYQYWVFIMLFKYLSKKYEDNYVTSDWITYDGKNLSFTLIEGRTCFAKFDIDEETQLHLLYNKTYDREHVIYSGRSYSHELKPDISLELFNNDKLIAIVHFDAKYRLPINGTDVPDDINKMHAYKDGIIGTIGSFAICLADEQVIYHEEEQGWENDGLFPAVGACPLNLNPDTIDYEMNGIYNIVDEFVHIEINKNVNRFSKNHLQRYYSLLRKMMTIKE